ncbi:MAG: hypothetical protein ACE5JQ_16010 [Candidatus Methylomirabilales bacterium]
MIKRVIFVYDADSGALAAMWDSAKKVVGSENACALCSITHGAFAEKAEWSEIARSLGAPTVYYHRDDVPAELRDFIDQKSLVLPLVVFEREAGGYDVAVKAEMLKNCAGDPRRLKDKLEAVLKNRTWSSQSLAAASSRQVY